MTSDQIANLLYLGLLGTVLAGAMLLSNKTSLGTKARHASIWVLIFIGAVAAAGLWGDIRQTVAPRQAVLADQGRIELPLAPDGHYYITLEVNDQPVRFVVDTGASSVVLTQEDARRIGFDPGNLPYLSEAMTANGLVKTAPVTLDQVTLGPIEDRRVSAVVNGGEMDVSLLGMTYLSRFDRIEITRGQLVLER